MKKFIISFIILLLYKDSCAQVDQMTFCKGFISISLFEGGRMERVTYSKEGKRTQIVIGTWTATGSPNDVPGQSIIINFSEVIGSQKFMLIRDFNGNPVRIIDLSGSKYDYCAPGRDNNIGLTTPQTSLLPTKRGDVDSSSQMNTSKTYSSIFPINSFINTRGIRLNIKSSGCKIAYHRQGLTDWYSKVFNGFVLDGFVYNSNGKLIGQLITGNLQDWPFSKFFFLQYIKNGKMKRVMATREIRYNNLVEKETYTVGYWNMENNSNYSSDTAEVELYPYAENPFGCIISSMAILAQDDVSTSAVQSQNDEGEISPPEEQNDEEKIFNKVEEEAQFPGGISGWTRYLTRVIEQNIFALEGDGKSGDVVILFIVDKEGGVSDVKALPCDQAGVDPCIGPQSKLAELAVNAIKIGPKWRPAVQNGRNVKSYRRQVVTFQLAEK